MAKIKFVITDYIEPDMKFEEEQCEKLGVDFHHYQLKNADPQELLEVSADADIVLINMARFNAEVIDGLRRCKLLMRHGIGYDNIDVEAATRNGIVVSIFPDYCVTEVAEQAIMLMIACQRKLVEQERILRKSAGQGVYGFSNIYPVYRFSGKTLGIVGFGRIGSAVFRMLQGFNMRFLINDPYLPEERKRQFGIETYPLEEVLSRSDIVTAHVPLKWGETYHMFDEPQFKLMKKDAIFVNTSRGAVVNLEALDCTLRSGELGMAGIDVYETEPPPADFPLLHNERAICTPHLSWLSEEAGMQIRQSYIENIRLFLNNQPPPNIVNPEVQLQFN